MGIFRAYLGRKLAPVTDEMVDAFRSSCSSLYPLAAVFLTEAELENHLKSVATEKTTSFVSPIDVSSIQLNQRNDEISDVAQQFGVLSCNNTWKANGDLNGQEDKNKKASKQKRKKAGNADYAKVNKMNTANV